MINLAHHFQGQCAMRLVLAAGLAAMVAASTPAWAETVWVGDALVTSAPSLCGSAAAVGDYATLIYRPAGTALGNAADSYLAYVSQRANMTMQVPNNTFRSGVNYASRYVTSYIAFGTNVAGVTAWALSPPTLATTTTHATLTATLANFYGVTGCTVSIRAALERAP